MEALAASARKAAEPDVIVIGAGVAGLYQLHRLRGLGLRVESSRPAPTSAAPGTGTAIPARASTWRAGPRLLLLRGAAAGVGVARALRRPADTAAYLNYVADKFDLRRDIRFGSRVVAAPLRRSHADRWTITLEPESRRARSRDHGVGLLSAADLADIAGRDSFAGQAFHTSRGRARAVGWPASASASSAPVPPPSSSSRPSPPRLAISPCSSARPTGRRPCTTGDHRGGADRDQGLLRRDLRALPAD